MSGVTLACLAGCSAAFASCSAKLAMSPDFWHRLLCSGLLSSVQDTTSSEDETYCPWVVVCCRMISFGLVFVMNALMWTLFVKSLQKCSSAVSSVTNIGTNLIFTAFLGVVLFQETLSLKWWMGATLVMTGLVLIHHGSSKNIESDTKKSQ